jgi:hypothetical protein
LASGFVTIHQDNASTFRSEGARSGRANACGGSGNQDDTISQFEVHAQRGKGGLVPVNDGGDGRGKEKRGFVSETAFIKLERAKGFEPSAPASQAVDYQHPSGQCDSSYTQIRAHGPEPDSELCVVVAAWPSLAEPLKRAVLAIVGTATPQFKAAGTSEAVPLGTSPGGRSLESSKPSPALRQREGQSHAEQP